MMKTTTMTTIITKLIITFIIGKIADGCFFFRSQKESVRRMKVDWIEVAVKVTMGLLKSFSVRK